MKIFEGGEKNSVPQKGKILAPGGNKWKKKKGLGRGVGFMHGKHFGLLIWAFISGGGVSKKREKGMACLVFFFFFFSGFLLFFDFQRGGVGGGEPRISKVVKPPLLTFFFKKLFCRLWFFIQSKFFTGIKLKPPVEKVIFGSAIIPLNKGCKAFCKPSKGFWREKVWGEFLG